MMDALRRDLFQSLRSLRRDPATTCVLVMTLAIGIGANAAMFSVLRGVILRPLPYPAPQQLVVITSSFPTMGFQRFWIDPPEYMSLQEWSESFSALGAYRVGEVSVLGAERPMRVTGATASAELFAAFGVAAQLGRVFGEDEDRPNAEPVVLVSHELWSSAYGARESLIGESITVDGMPRTVIGVMPPRFDLEEAGVAVWTPLAFGPEDRERNGNHFLYVAARLRDEVTIEEARTELGRLVAGWEERAGENHGPSPDGHPLHIAPMHDDLVAEARPAVLALLGAVGFLLLIACANVAGLLIARADTRRREMAVRAGLGAGRGRLLRQLLTENLVLGVIGAILGLVLARLGLQLMLREFPDSLPRADEIGVDGWVLAATATISILSVALFGLVPALSLSRTGVASLLRQGTQRGTGGKGWVAVRGGLVVVEVGLALALVVGSGLMVRSLWSLLQVERGFDSERLWSFELRLPSSTYPQASDQKGFYDRLLEDLRSDGAIESAAMVSGLPPLRRVDANDMEFEGLERREEGPAHNVDFWQFASHDALDVLGQRVVSGRGFRASDDGAEDPVVLVNQRLAEVFYPGEDPVGRRLRPGFGDMPWMRIVGVVENVPQRGLDQPPGTEVYFSYAQAALAFGQVPRTMNVVVRSRAARADEPFAAALRTHVWNLDPQLPVAGLTTVDDVIADTLARPRLLTRLLSVFGFLALFLAGIGLYGLLGKMVADRKRELGIRMAMGAQRSAILGIVLSRGAILAGLGLLLGTLLAVLVTRVLRSLLFGVQAADPLVVAAVALVLLATVGLGCLVPALRAMRLEPMSTLREE